jgi:cell fate regulator YaaT (PSP1 superfamily)
MQNGPNGHDQQTVEVRFKGTRRGYFVWSDTAQPLRLQEAVIIEVERGKDFGRVSAVGDVAAKKCGGGCSTGCAVGDAAPGTDATPAEEPRKSVLRRASQEEIRAANDLRRAEEDDRRKVMDRARHHDLVMKVSDCEWQFDRNKLTIYFTAEKRVDFRQLVRDLASTFRTRIELRQIGARDEAARLTGVGRCGREYCCSTWLTELSPVNLALAKDQHLSLNPSQISGGCGRLLCCLRYEHDFYVTSRRRFPKEGKVLRTAVGAEKVVAVDIFRERVFLRADDGAARIVPLLQLRDEMEQLGERLPTAENRAPAEPGGGVQATAGPHTDAPGNSAGDGTARSTRRRRRRGRGGAPPDPTRPEAGD